MIGTTQPLFMNNSPSTICDQILYLVKNSSLNFELHETPFSLNLKLKKSFAQYWNKAGQSAHQNHIPQHVTDTVHQPHHPHVGQPVIHPEKATQNQADVFNDQQVPQHQLHHPHYVTDPGHQSDQPDTYGDLAPGQVHDHHKQQAVNLVKKVKILEQTCNEEQKEKEHLQQEYLSIDKSYKKLVGENRELQVKHEQVCADMKTLKSEKDQFARELNTASVALTTKKKILNENQKEFDRRVSQFEKELLELSEFKEEKESEDRRRKRAEKKARQKKRKDDFATDEENKKDSDDIKNSLDKIKNEKSFSEPKSEITVDDEVSDDEAQSKKVKVVKQFPDPSTSRSDLNQNKPPDTKTATPESESKDNVMNMTAKELGDFLNDIVTNFRSRQASQ